jgi:hypothetical protein
MKFRWSILILAFLVLGYVTADCPCNKDGEFDWGPFLVAIVIEEILREVLS